MCKNHFVMCSYKNYTNLALAGMAQLSVGLRTTELLV